MPSNFFWVHCLSSFGSLVSTRALPPILRTSGLYYIYNRYPFWNVYSRIIVRILNASQLSSRYLDRVFLAGVFTRSSYRYQCVSVPLNRVRAREKVLTDCQKRSGVSYKLLFLRSGLDFLNKTFYVQHSSVGASFEY